MQYGHIILIFRVPCYDPGKSFEPCLVYSDLSDTNDMQVTVVKSAGNL